MSKPLDTLTFTVAYPAGLGVSPNERVHWGERASRNKLVRDLTNGHARAAVRALRWPCADQATLDLLVTWPKGARSKDEDNLRAVLKPLVDGLVDAKVVVNDSPDHLKLGELVQTHHKNTFWPLVKVTVLLSPPSPSSTGENRSE